MKKTIFILGLSLLALGACKKEGCTDSDATNYDSAAEKDDGSCTFSANVVFYYSQNTYLNYLLPNSHSQLEYFVDGTSYGTIAADNSWTGSSAPECSEPDLMVVTLDMAGQKSRLYNYEVKNANSGATVFTGSQVMQANSCNPVLLEQ